VPKLLLEDENLSDSQREYLKIIEQAGHSILNLTSSLREMKMIENKAITQHCKEVDIVCIIKQLIKERCCKYDISSEKIRVSSNCSSDTDTESFLVKGDEAFLYSILSNLLENAIEASAGRNPVTIDLSDSGSEKKICIHNCEEVPDEVRESFFEKYSSCGKTKGSGIGTYSSKIMVEAMGGRICMRTSKKEGTELCIYLPD
jgi:signal transduction histidine kinase